MTDALPAWLNPYQLVAWVRYRDAELVASASTANGLSALTFYSDAPKIGSVTELESALQEGRLIVFGAKKDESFAQIPAVEWTSLAIAPRDLARQHPYLQIQAKREDALRVFPASYLDGGEQKPKARNQQIDRDWVIARAVELRREQANLSIGSAAESLVEELPRNPRTKKRRDKRHIERMIAPLWNRLMVDD